MFSEMLDPPVGLSLFSLDGAFILHPAPPSLPVFSWAPLMRVSSSQSLEHLSRDDTEMNSIFSGRGGDWQRSTAEKPSGSTHSPTAEGPSSGHNPPMSSLNPGKASANRTWLVACFSWPALC